MYAGIPDKDTRKSQYFKNFNQLSNDISDYTVIHGSHFWGLKQFLVFLFLNCASFGFNLKSHKKSLIFTQSAPHPVYYITKVTNKI